MSDETDQRSYHEQVETTPLMAELLDTARARCDVVVVDTPPGLGTIVQRVLAGSEHVIVPLQAEPLALQTTPQILRAIQEVVGMNQDLTLDGILLTMVEPNSSASERVVKYVRSHLPQNMVFDIVVPRTVAAADAFAAGQPVVLRDPADAAAQAYVNLVSRLADRFA